MNSENQRYLYMLSAILRKCKFSQTDFQRNIFTKSIIIMQLFLFLQIFPLLPFSFLLIVSCC